jgi:hypothetical protein
MEASRHQQSPAAAFELSLRIRHPSIDPKEISRELQLAAEHSFKAGEPRESASGLATASVHNQSYWFATLDPLSWSSEISTIAAPSRGSAESRLKTMALSALEMTLAMITSRLQRTHGTFLRKLQAEGGEVGLLVELRARSARGFTLTPQLSRALSELGIAVDFEFVAR